MNEAVLDTIVLDALEPHWKKVALVIAFAAQDPRFESSESGDDFEMVAARISALLEAGRVSCQGNLADWRSSEIRLSELEHGKSNA